MFVGAFVGGVKVGRGEYLLRDGRGVKGVFGQRGQGEGEGEGEGEGGAKGVGRQVWIDGYKG